jgi:Fe-S-cluster-containing hydrogenase component 2
MGHLSSKDAYLRLSRTLDSLATRVPFNESLYKLLKELYTLDEADFVARMPYGLSPIERLEGIFGHTASVRKMLEALCSKGLVVDLCIRDKFYYSPSPMVIGIFEFTMMRTGPGLNTREWAKLFYEYMQGSDSFFHANLSNGERVALMRALPAVGAVLGDSYVEILDYEKASSIVASADKCSVGICSCRHEKFHATGVQCKAPLESCTSFGIAADYLIRNGLAREVPKQRVFEMLEESRRLGLVLSADNVRKNVTFICHCCSCCCNVLAGISKFGYPNAIVTSTLIASADASGCNGCGLCARRCPIEAIRMIEKVPSIDESFCIGCGVCSVSCSRHAMKLVKRKQRVLHPESTFERVILQSLEHGNLQNQLFDEPEKVSHKVLRGVVGGFLRLSPVKKTLMSDAFRSLFLHSLKLGAKMKKMGEFTEL